MILKCTVQVHRQPGTVFGHNHLIPAVCQQFAPRLQMDVASLLRCELESQVIVGSLRKAGTYCPTLRSSIDDRHRAFSTLELHVTSKRGIVVSKVVVA